MKKELIRSLISIKQGTMMSRHHYHHEQHSPRLISVSVSIKRKYVFFQNENRV
jgi:hypothetical protein